MTDHPISLRNSLTGGKQAFTPLDWQDGSIPEADRLVRMYVCGPTVYDRAHIGNARPAVAFDVLYRLLRHVYGAAHVRYVRNITDVDDKIMARAKDRGVEIDVITAETAAWYQEDMAAVGNLAPDLQPRATQFIPQMQSMIARLIASGHAYEAEGHVLFSVDSYAEYGALSGRSVEDMIAGARVEVAPYKKNPMDFVLWKPSTPEQQGWDSPWGRGRPGWHIECSAMSEEALGPDFDIHGGGSDLMFPHHENEIAQSCCANPHSKFARVWLHNGMIRIGGQKMSKSLGNFTTVHDLREQAPGEVIRLALLSTQYRGELDWTDRLVEDCGKALRRWRKLTDGVAPGAVSPELLAALCDDLNTPRAIAELHRLAREKESAALLASANLMGLLTPELSGWEKEPELDSAVEAAMDQIVKEYAGLRGRKEYALADKVRAALLEAGLIFSSNSKGQVSLKWDVLKAEAYFAGLSADRLEMIFGTRKVPSGQLQADYLSYVLKKVAKGESN